MDFPEAFVWWKDRFPGRTFPFECPDCQTVIELRQRVSQRTRACPGCGFKVTIAAIDDQLTQSEPDRLAIIQAAEDERNHWFNVLMNVMKVFAVILGPLASLIGISGGSTGRSRRH